MTDQEINEKIASKLYKYTIIVMGDELFTIVKQEKKPLIKYATSFTHAHNAMTRIRNSNFDFEMVPTIDANTCVTTFQVVIKRGNIPVASSRDSHLPRAICLAICDLLDRAK